MDPQPGALVTPALRLIEPLREGAMGAVWIAEHLERGERVAVKFVSSQGASDDPESAQRLRREARAALKVESVHVVRVLDHGETEDGTPYVAMELLSGESLGDLAEPIARHRDLEVIVLAAPLAEEEVDRPAGRYAPGRLDAGEKAFHLLGPPGIPLRQIGVERPRGRHGRTIVGHVRGQTRT